MPWRADIVTMSTTAANVAYSRVSTDYSHMWSLSLWLNRPWLEAQHSVGACARSERDGVGTLTEPSWEHQGFITILLLWQTALITCKWNESLHLQNVFNESPWSVWRNDCGTLEWRESERVRSACSSKLSFFLSFFFMPVYAPAALGTQTGCEKTWKSLYKTVCFCKECKEEWVGRRNPLNIK